MAGHRLPLQPPCDSPGRGLTPPPVLLSDQPCTESAEARRGRGGPWLTGPCSRCLGGQDTGGVAAAGPVDGHTLPATCVFPRVRRWVSGGSLEAGPGRRFGSLQTREVGTGPLRLGLHCSVGRGRESEGDTEVCTSGLVRGRGSVFSAWRVSAGIRGKALAARAAPEPRAEVWAGPSVISKSTLKRRRGRWAETGETPAFHHLGGGSRVKEIRTMVTGSQRKRPLLGAALTATLSSWQTGALVGVPGRDRGACTGRGLSGGRFPRPRSTESVFLFLPKQASFF